MNTELYQLFIIKVIKSHKLPTAQLFDLLPLPKKQKIEKHLFKALCQNDFKNIIALHTS